MVKGACEHGSGDGNSSLVFTISNVQVPGTMCLRTHAEITTQTNSFTLVADFRLKRGYVTCKHKKLKIILVISVHEIWR